VVKTGDAVEVSFVDAPGGALRATHIRAVASAGASSEAKPTEMVASGTVKSIAANTLTISGSAGGGATFTQSFTIDSGTKVVAKGAGTAAAAKGGKLAITEALGVGDRVSVSYHDAGNALQASEVRVTVKAAGRPKT
jgi:protein involved in polysaccharide export with SLBB domain